MVAGLYLSNGLAAATILAAFVTWMVQFYVKLTHNVLIREDRYVQKYLCKGIYI